MVNLKYFALLICFAQTLHYSAADNSTSALDSIIDHVLPDCFFGVQTISFILYTRNIPDGVFLIVKNMTKTDEFKKHVLSRPMVLLIHGFTSSGNNSNYIDLKDAMLDEADVFIISVDWKEGACSTGGLSLTELAGYYKAVENTRIVGQYIANLTKIFINDYDVKLDNILVIGHSLGAQVAGFAGKELQKMKVGTYRQIIGLDPANPLYGTNGCSERLCETDANFVQVIHTTMTLGMSKAIGNVDFYMNKGHLQPGCYGNPSCSHSRSVEYLTESVKHKCCFIGTPWKSYLFTQPISKCTKDTCVCVGFHAKDYPARGKFYVEIENDPPFCNNNGTVI